MLGAKKPANGESKSGLRSANFKDSGVATVPGTILSSTKVTFSELQSINVAKNSLHTSYSS